MSILLHRNKMHLIDLLKKVGIGIAESCNDNAPGNRKWKLSFWRLGENSPKWFGSKEGGRVEIGKKELYGRSLEDLYERALLNALKTSMRKVVWDEAASTLAPADEVFTAKDVIEVRWRTGSIYSWARDPVPDIISMFRAKRLINLDIDNCRTVEEVFLLDAIGEG